MPSVPLLPPWHHSIVSLPLLSLCLAVPLPSLIFFPSLSPSSSLSSPFPHFPSSLPSPPSPSPPPPLRLPVSLRNIYSFQRYSMAARYIRRPAGLALQPDPPFEALLVPVQIILIFTDRVHISGLSAEATALPLLGRRRGAGDIAAGEGGGGVPATAEHIVAAFAYGGYYNSVGSTVLMRLMMSLLLL